MFRLMFIALATLITGPALTFPVSVGNCGRTLTFDKPPERAVIHDLNMAEMAFALRLQPHLVGLTGITGFYKTTSEFDALRGALAELASKAPSVETLVAANADFFFAGWYYGMKPGGDVTPDTLARQGIKTLVLTESCAHLSRARPRASMDLLYGDILTLGHIFARQDLAKALVEEWKARVARVGEAVKGRAAARVFLYESGEDKPFTAGRFAMPTALIEAAGGTNVLDDMEASWSNSSWETVAARDPDFLILLDYQDEAGDRKLLAFLEAHPAMKEMKAVKERRFVPLRYEEITPGPANVGAIEKIARAMHPDVFAK